MYINKAKKIVIKLGSSTIVDKKGNFKKKWLNSLINNIGWCTHKLRPRRKRALPNIFEPYCQSIFKIQTAFFYCRQAIGQKNIQTQSARTPVMTADHSLIG